MTSLLRILFINSCIIIQAIKQDDVPTMNFIPNQSSKNSTFLINNDSFLPINTIENNENIPTDLLNSMFQNENDSEFPEENEDNQENQSNNFPIMNLQESNNKKNENIQFQSYSEQDEPSSVLTTNMTMNPTQSN